MAGIKRQLLIIRRVDAGDAIVKVGYYLLLIIFILAVLGPDGNVVFRQQDPYSFL